MVFKLPDTIPENRLITIPSLIIFGLYYQGNHKDGSNDFSEQSIPTYYYYYRVRLLHRAPTMPTDGVPYRQFNGIAVFDLKPPYTYLSARKAIHNKV